jgi:NADH:ubiquinone oxidoreductase subunit F (NADH-binding)/NADH:ubiquinone oxidoreductase subunit E/(2Fe-2S) ferredoxin
MALPESLSKFPRERTWLLPALHAVQHAERWLSPESLEHVAAYLRVPKSEVWGVASHYPEFRLTAPGRRLVRVCTGVACLARGARDILAACEQRLGVAAGQTTRDGAVTLEELDCAFACGSAPVVEVGHACHGRVSVGDVAALVAGSVQPAPPMTAQGGPPATVAAGSPGVRFIALKREAERRRTGARLAVGLGTCGLAVGAVATFEALQAETERRGLPFRVVAAGCNGMCWAQPVVEVLRDGRPRLTTGAVTPAAAPRLLNALAAGLESDIAVGAEFMAPQQRVLLDRCGVADPYDIADALRHGAYGAFARVLDDGRPETVTEAVRVAGLAGRGGAYFHAAVKWAACRAAAGSPKYLVVNGEEGEPGIFKDRHLMEGDPHRVLEAVLLAAFAAGASRAILYIHGEATLSAERLAVALEQARAWGLIGQYVLGTTFSLEVEIRRGAGGFVLGEETALLESIEGQRAMPRTRPPFPVESGLFGKPTVINNVETLSAVPSIVERGGAWFAGLGGGRGTKLFGLSGHLRRPGIVEMELGCTLRTLIEEVGGGSSTGRPIRAAVVGGPSGSIVHPRQFDEPLIPRGPVNPGTGGVVALDDTLPVRDAVRTLLAFNMRESCGKCTPCREGTVRLVAMLDGALDVPRVKDLAEAIQLASLCGLGQAAPLSLLSGLAEFPEDFGILSRP